VTTSRIPTRRPQLTSPVVDYEPPPVVPGACPPPSPAALRRRTPRQLRPLPVPAADIGPPRAATVFAAGALRRVLEVADRRRPVAQLRTLLTPSLIDAVALLTRFRPVGGAAVLRRVRLRSVAVVDGEATAAEVFASYTRGDRVRAIAGRVEVVDGRWLVTALQIG
jgi:hypothetical protein